MYEIKSKENYAVIEPQRNTIYVIEVAEYAELIMGVLISNDFDYLPTKDEKKDYDYGFFDLEDGNIYYIKKSDIVEIIEWHGTITQ